MTKKIIFTFLFLAISLQVTGQQSEWSDTLYFNSGNCCECPPVVVTQQPKQPVAQWPGHYEFLITWDGAASLPAATGFCIEYQMAHDTAPTIIDVGGATNYLLEFLPCGDHIINLTVKCGGDALEVCPPNPFGLECDNCWLPGQLNCLEYTPADSCLVLRAAMSPAFEVFCRADWVVSGATPVGPLNNLPWPGGGPYQYWQDYKIKIDPAQATEVCARLYPCFCQPHQGTPYLEACINIPAGGAADFCGCDLDVTLINVSNCEPGPWEVNILVNYQNAPTSQIAGFVDFGGYTLDLDAGQVTPGTSGTLGWNLPGDFDNFGDTLPDCDDPVLLYFGFEPTPPRCFTEVANPWVAPCCDGEPCCADNNYGLAVTACAQIEPTTFKSCYYIEPQDNLNCGEITDQAWDISDNYNGPAAPFTTYEILPTLGGGYKLCFERCIILEDGRSTNVSCGDAGPGQNQNCAYFTSAQGGCNANGETESTSAVIIIKDQNGNIIVNEPSHDYTNFWCHPFWNSNFNGPATVELSGTNLCGDAYFANWEVDYTPGPPGNQMDCQTEIVATLIDENHPHCDIEIKISRKGSNSICGPFAMEYLFKIDRPAAGLCDYEFNPL